MWLVWETPAPGKSPSCLDPSICSSLRWPSPSSRPSSPSVRPFSPYRHSFSMHPPNQLIWDKATRDKPYVIILWWTFHLNIRNVLSNRDFVVAHTFTEDINDFLLSTRHQPSSFNSELVYIYMYLHLTSSVGECMCWWETSGSSIFCHVFQVSWRVSLRSRSCALSCVCVWAFFLSIICSGVCRVCRAAPLCWSCFCAEPCSPCRTYTSTYFR